MKKSTIITLSLLFTLCSTAVFALDNVEYFSIKNAMTSDAAQQLGFTYGQQFYFGNQKYPSVIKQLGTITAHKKTNAFMKQPQTACRWVLYSALKSLRAQAIKQGGNAIINIHPADQSNIDQTHADKFPCTVGFLMADVNLTGDVVKIKQ